MVWYWIGGSYSDGGAGCVVIKERVVWCWVGKWCRDGGTSGCAKWAYGVVIYGWVLLWWMWAIGVKLDDGRVV